VIIGIDPGIANCGFALWPNRLAYTIKTPATWTTSQRLDHLWRHLEAIVANARLYNPESGVRVVIEDFITTRKMRGAGGVHRVIGVFQLGLKKLGVDVVLVKPRQWLQGLGVQGSGHKVDTMALVRQLGWVNVDQHAADAAGLVEWWLCTETESTSDTAKRKDTTNEANKAASNKSGKSKATANGRRKRVRKQRNKKV